MVSEYLYGQYLFLFLLLDFRIALKYKHVSRNFCGKITSDIFSYQMLTLALTETSSKLTTLLKQIRNKHVTQ